jgi:hypothetical protein
MTKVDGAPEILARSSNVVVVSVQQDGSRLVTISSGDFVNVVVVLPPLRENAVETNVEKGK